VCRPGGMRWGFAACVGPDYARRVTGGLSAFAQTKRRRPRSLRPLAARVRCIGWPAMALVIAAPRPHDTADSLCLFGGEACGSPRSSGAEGPKERAQRPVRHPLPQLGGHRPHGGRGHRCAAGKSSARLARSVAAGVAPPAPACHARQLASRAVAGGPRSVRRRPRRRKPPRALARSGASVRLCR
jgi:hypothetical protein